MAFHTRRPDGPRTPLKVGILGATGTVGQKLLVPRHQLDGLLSLRGAPL
jgi:hypothetical protein